MRDAGLGVPPGAPPVLDGGADGDPALSSLLRQGFARRSQYVDTDESGVGSRSAPAHPPREAVVQHTGSDRLVFVNLPVKDLAASIRFYAEIGCEQNHQFSNDQAAMMVWSDTISLRRAVK